MGKPVLGRFQYPTSVRQLTRSRGWNSELVGFLLPFARQDFIYKEYDFMETAITDDPNTDWTLANSTGTNYAKAAASVNGVIEGATGTTDNGGCSIIFDSVCFDAANSPGFHVRMKIDDVSECANEVSMSDAYSSTASIAVTDVDTPTTGNGVTDGVFVTYDTDQTQKGPVLVGVGASTSAAASTLCAALTTPDPFVDGTYFNVLLQCYIASGYGIVNHNPAMASGVASGPDTAVLMAPKVVTITRNTTTKNVSIDLMRFWVGRA